VTSGRTGRLTGVPADGKGKVRRLALPWKNGTTSVAAGFGSLWVTNGPQGRLVRLDPGTGRMQGDRLLGGGEAVVVTAGAGAIWVGRRAAKTTDPPSAVIKVLPGGQTKVLQFGQEGIGDLTTGGGYVWLANRRRSRVSRIDPATGLRKSDRIGLGRHRVAFGDGQVWVTNYDDSTVTQNDRGLSNAVTRGVNVRGPLGIAVARHTVLVAGNLEDSVVLLDSRTGDPVGEPIRVGRNPTAITAHGSSAWVANVGSASVTRLQLGSGSG
jgi:DNA-binding beta-propeller fold protein YncE